jgi:hypothetical protein
VPTRAVDLHEEAAAEYDAAFDWYLQRSSDAALKLDAGQATRQVKRQVSARMFFEFVLVKLLSELLPLLFDWQF